MRILATAGVLALLSGSAWAQAPAPTPTDLTKGTLMTSAELHAAIDKLGNDRPLASVRVFTLAGSSTPYAVNVEHRTNKPQAGAVHDVAAELLYIIDGSCTIVTGGKLIPETRTIEGGVSTKLNKGDFFMVPEGLPHWFSEIDPNGLNMMAFHLPRPK